MKVIIVDKVMTDKQIEAYEGKEIKRSMITLILTEDTDVYTKDNLLLCRFRKNVLNKKKVKDFFDNVIKFAMNVTTNRGTTSGQKKTKKNVKDNPKIMANILGYMDGFSPSQKFSMKRQNIYPKINVRESRFNIDYHDNWKKAYPMLKQIDSLYKKIVPTYYKKQRQKADQTHYKIRDTAFTTITTNVNFKTRLHKDRGDDDEGFGNLVVIEDGKYEGSETCFPQYGFGVDVRQNDILFMNVHEWHANLPMKPANKTVRRLSVVCYLRMNVWKITKGIDKEVLREHDKQVRLLGKHPERPMSSREAKSLAR